MTAVGVLGAGAVARALAGRLAAAGCPVRLWARDEGAARGALRGTPVTVASLTELLDVDAVLVCVRDAAITEVAARLAELGRPRRAGAAALHTSGYHGPEPMSALAEAGWAVGGMHPLVSFPPGGGGAERLAGAWFTLAGDGAARAAGRRLVALLGGRELALERGPALHAAAALAANGLVALLDLALETLGPAANGSDARAALAHLCAGVLANVAERGPGASLTGPVARGDAEVVRGHLGVLGPEARAVYLPLLRRMLALARARGLDAASADALEALLRDPPPGS